MFTASNIFRLTPLIALSVALVAAASDQSERIVVVSIDGNWNYEGARIKFGQTLPAKGCVFGSEGSVVLQADKPHTSPQPFVCEKPSRDPECRGQQSDRCAVPLDSTKWKNTGEGFGNLWAAVRQLFVGEPEKYMVAASRGIEPGLADAAVPLQGHNVDLAPAFREMGPGEYWVTVAPVNSRSSSKSTFELHFVPHSPATISASAIQPGLYNLVLVDKTGAPGGSDCWILVSSPEDFSSASQQFQTALQDSSKWPQDMDPSAVRALLRAYLESLAISQTQSRP